MALIGKIDVGDWIHFRLKAYDVVICRNHLIDVILTSSQNTRFYKEILKLFLNHLYVPPYGNMTHSIWSIRTITEEALFHKRAVPSVLKLSFWIRKFWILEVLGQNLGPIWQWTRQIPTVYLSITLLRAMCTIQINNYHAYMLGFFSLISYGKQTFLDFSASPSSLLTPTHL